MKTKFNYSILLITVFLFTFQLGFAQSGTNPFNVKKKTSPQLNHKPDKLNQGLLQSENNVDRINIADQGFNHASIPFVFPGSIDKNAFEEISYAENGLLNFAESKKGSGVNFDLRSQDNTIQACFSFMNNIKAVMHINNPADEFKKMTLENDEYGWTYIKMQQYYKGVEVYGGQVILHGKNNLIVKLNGTYYPTPKIDNISPAIDENQVSNIVVADVKTIATFKPLSIPEMQILNYSEPIVNLIIYHPDRKLDQEKLAYHVTVRPNFLDRYEYFVDAKTGGIIDKYNNTCTDGPATAQAVDLNGISRTINTYLVGSKYYMIDGSKSMFNVSQSQMPDNPVGGIMTLDANNTTSNDMSLYHITSTNNSWNNPTAVSAQYNADYTFNYYKNTHNRTSINGQGGTIISIINIADDNGSGLDNAFWNGQAMFYGNGNQLFLPLAGALDVGAHEMTHGVIQNTANLEYKNESGAINEAMADIAGTMVDRNDWQLGEDVIPSNSQYFPTGALRDMQNPHNGGSSFSDPSYQPMHTNEKYTGSNDNGGVHTNSGIINHAYYLLAEAISKDKAEKLFYRALSQYMTKSSQFIDCRLAFEQSAKDLYGNNSTEYNAVVNAFFGVGIGEQGGGGDGSDPPGGIPVNPGQDYIVSVDVNNDDPNTLYISNTNGTGFVGISQTKVKRKLSVTDDGSVAAFVDENDIMKAISMTDPFDEWQLSPDEIWDNVAVSKGGERIAAITTEIDSAIWVYDFTKEQWAKFHLFNPTFTDGVVTQNVLYADAIEWDYTGQYLIYDAYNELQNNQGDNIDYWDMGFIKVWNNATNNWGDGDIFKLFSNLPEGISVGNPSLAKNSPYIITFDYFDANSGDIYLLAANLETGDIGELYQNTILGFPNYSKLDDKIVFGDKDNGNEIVSYIKVGADKINPAGPVTGLINVAKFPVWYATGIRDLNDIKESKQTTFFTNVYPNPFSGELNIVLDIPQKNEYQLDVFDIYGKLILQTQGTTSGQLHKETLDLNDLPDGTYFVQVKADNQLSSRKVVKIN